MENTPLVSICVLTYNSSSTILETLESIKNQTYQNIELFVCDDGSKDSTVELSKKWLSSNAGRFVNCDVITVPKNTGTSANYNRAVKTSNGEWIKMVDGDDQLFPNCIQDNINNSKDADFLISQFERFDGEKILPYTEDVDFNWFCNLPSKKRSHFYARTNLFANPITHFIKASVYQDITMYDESEPLLEDVPFLLKIFDSDLKIKFLPLKTVRYRNGGISNSNTVSFQKILIHSYFKYNINYLDTKSIVDRFLIWERKLYRYILDKDCKILLNNYYKRRNPIFVLTKYLKYNMPL